MSRKILVRIRRRDATYPVAIPDDSSLARAISNLKPRGRRACIITDAGFARARPDALRDLKKIFPSGKNLYISVPGGEKAKTWKAAGAILGRMMEAKLTRHDLCVAVGGGATGDLASFVASLYHRGMNLAHVPTTLLAMVDSSVGGKTAVNHALGKNLIGTFHQPVAVVAWLGFLRTLPQSDLLSGLGEVFKYAAGFSPALFRYLAAHRGPILARERETLARVVAQCVAIKARIVARDERELAGAAAGRLDRRLLNFGHTTGHGLEKAYRLPHGVAVAAGVTLAAKLSARLGLCSWRCYDDIMALARDLGLRTEADLPWKLHDILPYVRQDKKAEDGRIQFVCLKGIGRAVVRPTRLEELRVLEDWR